MSYRTKVFHQPVTEPVPHQQVIKSTEFRAICKMINDNNLLWSGRKPRRTYRQVRTLFSEATDGLDINDEKKVTLTIKMLKESNISLNSSSFFDEKAQKEQTFNTL